MARSGLYNPVRALVYTGHDDDRAFDFWDEQVRGFVELDAGDIETALRMSLEYPDIMAAMEYSIDALCGGGVSVTHPDIRAAVSSRWSSKVWGDFVHNLCVSLWRYGIAVCSARPNEDLLTVPYVVELDLLAVRVLVDSKGRRVYAIRDRPNRLPMAQLPGPPALRSDVLVYESQPPLASGRLVSTVLSLRTDASLLSVLSNAAARAALSRSDPMQILERTPEAYNPSHQQMALLPAAMGDPSNDRMERVSHAEVEHMDTAMRTVQLLNAGLSAKDASLAVTRPSDLLGAMGFLTLPRDTRISGPTMAEEPSSFMDLKERFTTCVARAFRVPLTALLGQSHGRAPVNESNSHVITRAFDLQQRKLKAIVVPIMRDLFVWCHVEEMAIHALADDNAQEGASSRRATTTNELAAAVYRASDALIIDLPGVPNFVDTSLLYATGLLRYPEFIRGTAMAHGMPLEFFEAAPVMDRAEFTAALNGRPMPAAAAAGGGARKASATKGTKRKGT